MMINGLMAEVLDASLIALITHRLVFFLIDRFWEAKCYFLQVNVKMQILAQTPSIKANVQRY